MTHDQRFPSASWAPLIGLVLGALLVEFAAGVNAVMLPLRMQGLGFSITVIGTCLAMEILGVVLFCKFTAATIARLGIARALALATALRAGLLWLMPLLSHMLHWVACLFVYGIVTSMTIIALQTWLNALPFGRFKTFCVGLYSSALSAGVAIGPLALAWGIGVEGEAPFRVNSLVCLLLVVVLLPIQDRIPQLKAAGPPRILFAVNNARQPMTSAFVGGITFFGLPAFLTLYGVKNGLSVGQASMLITVFMLGSISLGLAIAALSGFVNRRLMLILCVFTGMLCSVYLPLAVYRFPVALALLFIWGGVAGAIYAISLADIGALFRREDQVSANVAYTVLDCLGGTLGVFLIGLAMDHLGLDGLTYVIEVAGFSYFIFILSQLRVD